MQMFNNASGERCKGEDKMTALVQSAAKSATRSTVMPFVAAMVLGLGIVTLAGHVQASALHDAAHDVRHATGFPCH